MSTLTAGAAAAPPRAAPSGDRVFYTGMAVAAALAVLIGFARTFYLRGRFEPTPLVPLLVVHGVVFSAWMVLFAAQTSLIAARRAPIHRRMGWAGAGLAAAMVVVALAAAVTTGRRDIAAGYETESLEFFATPVLSMAVFALLVAAAVAARGRPETHKRLMLLATVSLLDAAFARWPIAGIAASPLGYYGLTDAFIVAAILYDLGVRRRVHAVYIWGGLLIVAGQWAREPLGATAVWQAFARAVLD
jgi:hypothetical protein